MSKKANKSQQRFHSTIKQHHVRGKTLVPPLANLPKMQAVSWINDRLPEYLWAALLVSQLPQQQALSTFHRVAHRVYGLRELEPPYDISHTGLSLLKPGVLQNLLEAILATEGNGDLLSPLLLFQDLPAREYWERLLPAPNTDAAWNCLATAVAQSLDHQSQEATDCRWLPVICMLAAGKVHFPGTEEFRELVREFVEYPNYGDMTKVRPSIRAMELSLSAMGETQREWPGKFWSQCLTDTPCYPLAAEASERQVVVGTTVERVQTVYGLLAEHCHRTRTTSATDARHDTIFGVGLYCLSILQELLRIGASGSITARSALRTIGECYITLSYLAWKEDPELWKSYRVFGAGQAKLTYLKLEELGARPSFVDVEALHRLANEDVWQEFLPIQLGHWEKANLRKMSEDANVKDDYDRFYSWTSSFSHGHWGSVRDATFVTCGNPLHRVHRIPALSAPTLPDVLPDACTFVDKVLGVVSHCYPSFSDRVTVETS